MDLYCYVIATDAGSAPNYDPPFTTLAVCKPKLRTSAQLGDAVLAFTGADESREPHAVRWAGVIKEKLSFSDYWNDRRFAKKKPGRCERPDNIYQPQPGGQGFWQAPNRVHELDAMKKDVGGQFVLIFDPVWRFAGGSPVMPADFGFRMFRNARRGHRVHATDSAAWRRLRDWLDDQKRKSGVVAHVKSNRRCEPERSDSRFLRLHPNTSSRKRRPC
jgi:Nucleotide modification associated domain 2